MESHEKSPIRVHCTVDPSKIVVEGEKIICSQCDRQLLNLCEGGDTVKPEHFRNGKAPCGIFSKTSAAALVSALTLASCSKEAPAGETIVTGLPAVERASDSDDGATDEKAEKDRTEHMIIGSLPMMPTPESPTIITGEMPADFEKVVDVKDDRGNDKKLWIGKMSADPPVKEVEREDDAETYPVAQWHAEGESVVSPYTKKVVVVKGISKGALVTDPASPISEKKFFRIPE